MRGGLEVEVEAVGRVDEVEGDAELVERGLDEAIEALVEGIGDCEADEQIDRGVDEALAELAEMLQQAHAGEFCAVCDGGPDVIDDISHAGEPRSGCGLWLVPTYGGREPVAGRTRRWSWGPVSWLFRDPECGEWSRRRATSRSWPLGDRWRAASGSDRPRWRWAAVLAGARTPT